MLAAAKHDVLVIADADMHVAPDWLHRLVVALDEPGGGAGDDGLYRDASSTPLPPPPSREGRAVAVVGDRVAALVPLRSTTISCLERCWREPWGGRTAWGPR